MISYYLCRLQKMIIFVVPFGKKSKSLIIFFIFIVYKIKGIIFALPKREKRDFIISDGVIFFPVFKGTTIFEVMGSQASKKNKHSC